MLNVAVLGGGGEAFAARKEIVQRISIDGVELAVGLVPSFLPEFRPSNPNFANSVLVKKKAFSLNYRERRGILLAGLRGRSDGYYVVGTDFVGEVVEVGAKVQSLKVGDRVIGNNSYPRPAGMRVPQGLASTHASRQFEVFHEIKLLTVPPEMTDDIAACFGVGAQTAYAMLRRLQVQAGSKILVTAARSNTSLFVINALKKYNADIYAVSRSNRFDQELRKMGVKQLITPLNGESFEQDPIVRDVIERDGGFSFVIDPLADLYCRPSLSALAQGGEYITCGFLNQSQDFLSSPDPVKELNLTSFSEIVVKNLRITGNCLGSSEDLQRAVDDYAKGEFPVTLDAVLSGDRLGELFLRSYVDPDRFGKVVYKYSD